MDKITKKVALYVRVSSEKQEKEKTIQSQLDVLREICKEKGLDIIKEYSDNGYSGSLLQRPALDELRDDAKNGLFDTLYIYSPDRLSRNHLNQLIITRELKKHNIEIIFRDKPLDSENKLLFDIESIIGEYEKTQILERTRRGKLFKAKQGKIISSKVPFGYKFGKDENGEKTILADKREAKAVNTIYDLYIQKQNTSAVARELNKRGIMSREKRKWRVAGICTILERETYIGNWHYGKTEVVKPKNPRNKFPRLENCSYRQKAEWITIKVEPIVSEPKFEMVKLLLKKNKKLYGRTKRFWLLRGLLHCADCGERMSGDTKKEYKYYRCSKGSVYGERNCGSRSVKAEDIEEVVWNKIKEALLNPKVLLQYSSLLKDKNKDKKNLDDERRDLLRQIETIGRRKNKLFDLYEDDGMEKEILMERLGIYTEEKRKIENVVKEIDIRLKQMGQKNILIDRLKEFSKVVKVQFDIITDEEKRALLQSIIKDIRYDSNNKEVHIDGAISLGEITENKREVKPLNVATSPVLSQQDSKPNFVLCDYLSKRTTLSKNLSRIPDS